MSIATSSLFAQALTPVRSGALGNGIGWTCWPEPRDAVVTCQVWLAAGSADERAGATGAAHMLEHLMFRGTPAFPDGEFDARMEGAGALVNAATWLDSTFYTTTCATGALADVLALEADRFAGLAWETDVFAAERSVVANERRQVVDALPEASLREQFCAVAHAGTPYAWPVIGWADDIAGYTPASIAAFFDAHYVSDAMHVVVCGPVEVQSVSRLLEQTFGRLPQRRRAASRRDHQLSGLPRQMEVTLPLATPRLLVGFDAPARRDPAFPAWRITQQLLAGGESSRLPVRLEFDDQLALGVDLDLAETVGPSVMTLEATARQDVDVASILSAVDEELEQLATRGPTPEALARVIRCQLTDDARALSSTQSRAEWLGESWVTFEDPLRLFGIGDQMRAVRPSDVQAVATSMLDGSLRTIGIGVPA